MAISRTVAEWQRGLGEWWPNSGEWWHIAAEQRPDNGRTNDDGPRPHKGSHGRPPDRADSRWMAMETTHEETTMDNLRTETVTDRQHAGRRTTNKSTPLIIRSKEEELSRKKKKEEDNKGEGK